jgi:Lipid desaturase domain
MNARIRCLHAGVRHAAHSPDICYAFVQICCLGCTTGALTTMATATRQCLAHRLLAFRRAPTTFLLSIKCSPCQCHPLGASVCNTASPPSCQQSSHDPVNGRIRASELMVSFLDDACAQAHHQRPWTITEREFANNVHKVFKPALPFVAACLLASPVLPPWASVFLSTATFFTVMSQQFHAWSHMKASELPQAVIAAQVSVCSQLFTLHPCVLDVN